MSQTHSLWKSRFGFIMAATGAAVGLGNIWKFPYMAGQNGGALFVGLYFIFLFAIGVPAMIAEVALGKYIRKNAIDGLQTIRTRHQLRFPWAWVGYLGAFGLVLVLGFYSAIAGWSLAYIFKCLFGGLSTLSDTAISQTWEDFLASPSTLLLWHSFYLGLTLYVVARGVNAGIERLSNWAMPLLFLMLLFLVGYSALHGDFAAASDFLLKLDTEAFSAHVVLAAMGQALFSLAVGAGAMMVYGAYVPEPLSLGSNLSLAAFLNGLVALLSGFAIFPLVFHYGLSPEAGPDLMFRVLPLTFNQMFAGQFVGALFFFLLFIAALTSSFSQAEPLVMLCCDKFRITRPKSALLIGSFSWVVGLVALLSFNVLSDWRLFGQWTLFDVFAQTVTDIILPLGTLGFACLAAWVLPSQTIQSVSRLTGLSFTLWQLLTRFIVPLTIIWILLSSLT